jgi:hypothetical protein
MACRRADTPEPTCHSENLRSSLESSSSSIGQFIMLKALRCVFRSGLDRILRRRLAGFNPVSKSLAKHAYWTEFHCSRKLVAAARAGALGLRLHGFNRPSEAIKASQSAWISSSISAGSETVRPTSSRNSAVYRFRNRWISVLTPPAVI